MSMVFKKRRKKLSLKLICGRSGTGKSEYCFNEIVSRVKDEKKIYMITPEQFSYAAEKRLLEKFENGAAINAEVLSFNRMAYRVAQEQGGSAKELLSKSGKAMIIYKILSKYKKELKFLGKTEENIQMLSTALTEFKKHRVLPEDLNKIYEKTEDEYLKLKIKDMNLVYKEFEDQIQDKFIDENDSLTILASKLENSNIFKDTVIYIDEFTGFTKQEYEIIKILLNKAKEVNITITTNDLDMGKTNQDTDLFYSNKQTADKILFIARTNNIKCEKTVFLNDLHRFKNKELIHIEKNLYENLYTKYDENVENVKLFLANNAYSEVENVAKQITKLVREENYRYREIAVVAKNLESYSSLIKVIFNKYNIPVFIDEKKDINQNMFIKYIVSILEIFSKNWSYEAIFNYIKTGFLNIDEDDIYALENYCLKWGINRNKWYKEEWKFGDNKEEIEKMEALRKLIVIPILELKQSLSGAKTVKEISENLYNFLIKNEIDKKIEKIKEEFEKENNLELANEQEHTWNIVIDVLDEIVSIFGEEKISFDNYNKLLKIGLNASNLGKIPATQDEVIVGDVSRSKQSNVKISFIINVNDGVYPSVNKDEGFFDDADRMYFKQNGLELAKTTIENIYEESFSIYEVFTLAREKVFISYSSSALDGGSLRPSILITKIKKIFPKLKEESDIIVKNSEVINKQATFEELISKLALLKEEQEIEKIWYDVFNYYSNDSDYKDKLISAMKALYYKVEASKITDDNINKLYGDTLNTTVSRLEQYKSCPFSYFLTYGLKLNEKEEFKVKAIDTGSFMHETIDEFFTVLRQRNISVKDIDEKYIYEIIEEIVNEKLHLNKNYIFTATPKYQLLAVRLKRVVFKSMKYIIESLKNSDFEVWGNEIEFKDGKTYEPITIKLEDGKKVKITGKIDRLDIANYDNKKLIRIIDYKSSIKNIDLNEVVAGIQIQLLTYLDATCKDDMMPAGVLYFNLIDPIIKSKRNLTDEEIEEEIRKRFKMQGLILADVRVVKMMDKSLDKGQSKIIPAYIDKDENLSMSKSNAVTYEQFKYLQKYTNKIIKEISKEILSGNIDIKPCYNTKNKKTPCEYCSYKGICNFKAGEAGSQYNYLKNDPKEVILDMIKED